MKRAEKRVRHPRAELTKSGFVYVTSNIGSFGEQAYKIGRAAVMERIIEPGGGQRALPIDVHDMLYCDNAPQLETALHQLYAERRLNLVNARREFHCALNPFDRTKFSISARRGLPGAFRYRPRTQPIGVLRSHFTVDAVLLLTIWIFGRDENDGAFPWLSDRNVGRSGITVISDAFQLRFPKEPAPQGESQAWDRVRGGAGVVLPALLARSAIRRSRTVRGRWLGGRPALFGHLRSQGGRRGRDSASRHPVEIDEGGDPIV